MPAQQGTVRVRQQEQTIRFQLEGWARMRQALAVQRQDMIVKVGMMISERGGSPRLAIASCSATVPLLTATPCLRLQ